MPKEKPKKAVHKQVGEKKVKKHVHHPPVHDEHGNIVEEARDEVIEVVVPVMGTVYEKMSDEEFEELNAHNNLPHEKSPEERLTELENTVKHLTDEINKLKDKKPKPK